MILLKTNNNNIRFRGGLDILNDDTGEESVFEKYSDSEIMFHVSTLLPSSLRDSQHLEKKRHIGNDRVTIVFQDENTVYLQLIIHGDLRAKNIMSYTLSILLLTSIKTQNFMHFYKYKIILIAIRDRISLWINRISNFNIKYFDN